jgi:hypothetical protein
MRFTGVMLASAVVGALTMGAALAGGKEEPKPSVTFAKSWEAAIDEAKTLNVPIVMHNHGFYCGPCWGMHAAVLKNDKYIEFAADNTVEVIAEQDLQKGIDEGKDPRGHMYDAKDENGKPVRYMIEWPGLTLEQMLALHASPASSYNHTGGIPYTSIIDPFTLQEMKGIAGGGHAAKEVMAEVETAKAQLAKDHGPSLKRSVLQKYQAGAKAVEDGIAKSPSKSLADFRKLETSIAKEPDSLKAKAKELETKVLDAVKADLDKAEGLIAAGDVKAATALLRPYAGQLKGTDLDARLKELTDKLKPAAAPAK